MSPHEIITTILGFGLVIGAPVAYKKYEFDGLISLIAFCSGISLVVCGHC